MRVTGLLGFTVVSWLLRLGGPGLILLGLADNSVVPLPGSMDVFVILLSSANRDWWPYYGFMGTLGAVLGGYVTYRLAEKGGEETLERKAGKRRAEKVYDRFAKHGFATVVAGSILPPPFPIVPFLSAAGVLQYPRKKFLAALSLGRGVRYFALAYVAHIYGKAIIHFFAQYKDPLLYALIALAALGGIGALLYFKFYRPRRRRQEKAAGEPVEEFPIPGKGNLKAREEQGDKEHSSGGRRKTA
jgi:membrane protein YqaA with SNARE-associated domain